MIEQLVNISQASKMLGVHQTTLRLWDNSNYLKSIKTKGGHRRYKLSDLINFQNKNNENNEVQ
jgi:putative resolvase